MGSRPLVVFTPAEQRKLRAFDELRCVSDDGAFRFDSFLERFADLVGTGRSGAYRLAHAADDRWGVDFVEAHGFGDRELAAWRGYFDGASRSATAYDPLRPEREQRNHAVRPSIAGTAAEETRKTLYPAMGVGDHDELRALVCDGPMLLAWVGAFRERRFDAHDARLFDALVPALRRRLTLDRKLRDARVAQCGLTAALEEIGAPTFLVGPGGIVAYANRAGRELLERAPSLARELGRVWRSPLPGARTTLLRAAGMRDHALVVLRGAATELGSRLDRAREAWKLTPRQRDVVELVLRGDSNKVVATKLGCTESTVEQHLTRIFVKARVTTRAELAAAFWTVL